jgi:F0F1-type ATP synthase assembly protein I
VGEENRGRKGEDVMGFQRWFMNYGLMACVFVGTAGVGVLAYRLEGSPWRWPLVALVLAGIGTIAGIFWIRKYVDRQTKASEPGGNSEGKRAT